MILALEFESISPCSIKVSNKEAKLNYKAFIVFYSFLDYFSHNLFVQFDSVIKK